MQHLVRITIAFFVLCLTSNVVWSKSHIINLECFLNTKLINSISINKKTKRISHLNHISDLLSAEVKKYLPKSFNALGIFTGRFVSYEFKHNFSEELGVYVHHKYVLNRETLRMNWSIENWVLGSKQDDVLKFDYPCKIIQLKKNKF